MDIGNSLIALEIPKPYQKFKATFVIHVIQVFRQ